MSSINPLYSLSGLLVGLLVGQTGVGGGSLMTPLLVLAFGIHPATAVGTDLLYASVTKRSGSVHRACDPPCSAPPRGPGRTRGRRRRARSSRAMRPARARRVG